MDPRLVTFCLASVVLFPDVPSAPGASGTGPEEEKPRAAEDGGPQRRAGPGKEPREGPEGAGGKLTLSQAWSVFVPVSDLAAFRQASPGEVEVRQGYAIRSPAGPYEAGGGKLGSTLRADLVFSVLPRAWLERYRPLVDQLFQQERAQLENTPELAGFGGILEAELEMGLAPRGRRAPARPGLLSPEGRPHLPGARPARRPRPAPRGAGGSDPAW